MRYIQLLLFSRLFIIYLLFKLLFKLLLCFVLSTFIVIYCYLLFLSLFLIHLFSFFGKKQKSVIRVFGVCLLEGSIFAVLEYCENGSLIDYLHENKSK